MKDMRQNSAISATSAAGGATGAGDLQSDTWSVDAYASEEGSEPPPEPTSVERLSVSQTTMPTVTGISRGSA